MTASSARVPLLIPTLAATALVVLGFGDLPYGYYVLLRLVLCGISLYVITRPGLALPDWQRWVLGGCVALYNPFLPVRIGEKAIWEVLNVMTIILFWIPVSVSYREDRRVRRMAAEHRQMAAEGERLANEYSRLHSAEDKTYADAYFACLNAGGSKHEAYVAARKAIGKEPM